MESIVGRNRPVGIIGGGISGWCMALELARRNRSSFIVDVPPVGGYSTTANQGWLHSGALYLAKLIPDEVTAQACREGSRLLSHYNRGFFQSVVPCYFLYYSEDQRDSAIKRCLDFGIPADAVSIEELKRHEPLLQGSPLRYAMQVADHPIDSARLLEAIVQHACAMGVRFVPVSRLEALQITRNGDSFSILLDSTRTIECQDLVFACGVMIPGMLEVLLPRKAPPFQITKNPVLSLSGDVALARSMLIVPTAANGPSIVPFERATGRGISVCTLDTEEPISDYRDRSQSPEWEQQLLLSLAGHFPRMKTLAQHHTILAHIHTCQKLHFSKSRRPVCLSYPLEPGGPGRVFALYPGKMTSAFVLAKMCVDELMSEGNEIQEGFNRVSTEVPDVARQPYGEHFADQLVLEGDDLVLRKRY